MTATVKDAHGNPEPNQTVVLSTTGSNNVFSPVSGTTSASGVFTATVTSTLAQNENITATIGTVAKTVAVGFTAGPPTTLASTLAINPTSLTANGNTTAITVTVKDAHGNPVANQSVVLAGSGTANTFNPQSGNTLVTGVFTATLSSTLAQNENIIATAGAMVLSAPVTFTASSPNSITSTFTVSPNTLVADGVTQTSLTVTVKDAQGNPVPSQAVTFVPGPPASGTSQVTVSPSSVPNNGTTTTTVTVTVKDANGNAVPNQAVSVAANGSNNSWGNLFGTSGTTSSSGTWFTTLASTTAQTETITATIGTVTEQVSITFYTSGPPSAAMSSFTASPNIVTADGSSTTTLTVTARDASGNPVPNAAVTFSGSGPGTFSATTGNTDASGLLTVTLSSTLAQMDQVTAAFGISLNTNVTFVAGAPAALAFSASPGNSNVAPCTVPATVSIRDAHGNACTTATNTVTMTIGTNPNSATLSGTTSVAATGGIASFANLALSAAGTGYTLVASSSGLTSVTSASFNVGATCSVQTTATSVGVASITGISSGDFDHDGNMDVAVAASGSKTIKILYGDGTGAFGARTFQPTITASFSNIVTPDLNGDGYADLAITNSAASSNAGLVYLNNRAGNFNAPVSVALGANANTITAIDVNGDGHLDLIAGGASSMNWVINSGTGTFGSNNTLSVTGPVWYPSYSTAISAYAYVEGSTASFTQVESVGASTVTTTGTTIVMASAADPGRYFAAVVVPGFSVVKFACLLGTGAYSAIVSVTSPNGRYVGLADMNKDGSSDSISSNDTGVEIHFVTPSGSCVAASGGGTYPTGHKTIWATEADFNNDGYVDVATANYDDNSVTTILLKL